MTRADQHDALAGDRTKRRLEAIAGSIGAALTIATLAVLIYDGIAGDGGPPVIVVEPGDTRVVDGRHFVDVQVRNTGDATAATVVVEGVLRRGDEVIETRELQLDYVSPRTEHHGGMVFTHDPAQHVLELRASSWAAP